MTLGLASAGGVVAVSSGGAATDEALALRVRNVESAYGPVRALRGVALQVERGSIVAVLGSNGAGKTTLLRTISGVVDPVRGSIDFEGRPIAGLDPDRIVSLGIAHVPEGREVFPLLSVRDNLAMGAFARADRDAAARDLEAIHGWFPVLRERSRDPAGQLSGGQQQMLAIGRALMTGPRLILLDEPSLGLSPRLTREIFEIVVRINRERGTTILVVEQNARLALNVADRGYVLENGRVVMEDRCEVLREKDEIRECYLGIRDVGERGERRWKRRKAWR